VDRQHLDFNLILRKVFPMTTATATPQNPLTEAQFRELYPEQYNNLLVLAAGAATNVEQTKQPGNDKLAQAVTIVLKAAYDIVDMFANFPEFVDKFVKDTLIPQLVQRAFDLLKYTGVLQAAPTVLPA
jgi:hypothetical protein